MVNSISGTPQYNKSITIGPGGNRGTFQNPNANILRSQSSSILSGQVTSVGPDNQVVFTTATEGNFILNDINNALNAGDLLKIQVKPDGPKSLSGTILQINQQILGENQNRNLILRHAILENEVQIDTNQNITSSGSVFDTKLLSNNIKDFLQKIVMKNLDLPPEQELATEQMNAAISKLVSEAINNGSFISDISNAEIGSSFTFKVLSTIQQNKNNLDIRFNDQGKIILDAKLMQQNPFGSAILVTPLGLMSLTKDILIPKDHILQLILEGVINNSASGEVINDVIHKSTDFLLKVQNYWPALEKLSKFLKLNSDSKDFHEEVSKILPGTDSSMLYKIIKYAEGIKSGNILDLISERTVQKFKDSGAEDIINELADDFLQLKNLYSDNNDLDNWQSLLVPIFDGEMVHHTRIFSRKSSKDGVGQIRFVIELALESNGDMQMDGLVKMILGIDNKSKVTKFDLVIRTLKGLDQAIRAGIQDIFINNQKIIGIGGMLRFEEVKSFNLKPFEEVKSKRSHNGDGLIA